MDKESWESGTRYPMLVLCILRKTKAALKLWNNYYFGNIFYNVQLAERNLIEVEKQSRKC